MTRGILTREEREALKARIDQAVRAGVKKDTKGRLVIPQSSKKMRKHAKGT